LLLDFECILTKYDLSVQITIYVFEKQRRINYLVLDFSSVCEMVVYKVAKPNNFLLLQTH